MKRSLFCNGWTIGSIIVVLAIMLPLYEVIHSLFLPSTNVWMHIRDVLLIDYVKTTVFLVTGTVIVAIVYAVIGAWFVTTYDFPGRGFLQVGLLLPIAIPPYIGAFTYSGFLSYTGIVQTTLQDYGIQVSSQLFSLSNIGGAIFIFSLFTFPYIYIAVRVYLSKYSASILESARLLGDNDWQLFWRLVLPLLRTPIVAGSTIVALDVLNDYAIAGYFGIGTLSLAVLKSWQNFSDITSALRISGILLLFVGILLASERWMHRRKSAATASTKTRPLRRKPLRGWIKLPVLMILWLIVILSLLLPIAQMLYWSYHSLHNIRTIGLETMAFNTFWVATCSAGIILLLAIFIAHYKRIYRGVLSNVLARLSVIGYTIPGAVIAISVLVFFLNWVPSLSTSLVMLIFAYVVRYFMIAYQQVETGFEKIGLHYHYSSRTLGKSNLYSLLRIDLPLIKPALLGAFVLSFVDIAKELSIILILRPFNFYTLSTKVFEYAHDEMIPESSIPSLLIIGISLIPILMHYFWQKED